MNARTFARGPEWLVPALLILLSLVPASAGIARLVGLVQGAQVADANARFFAMPLPVILHIVSVIPFSILGALQFAPALRRHGAWWHRASGRALVVFGMVAALSGLWMAHFYPWPEGDGEILYILRLVFGSAMAMAIVLAVDAIRRRDFAAHGAWMIRGYAIAMGAGTQVLTHIPYFLLVGKPGESSRAVLMGAGWIINVVVAEWIIIRMRAAQADERAHDSMLGCAVTELRRAPNSIATPCSVKAAGQDPLFMRPRQVQLSGSAKAIQ